MTHDEKRKGTLTDQGTKVRHKGKTETGAKESGKTAKTYVIVREFVTEEEKKEKEKGREVKEMRTT